MLVYFFRYLNLLIILHLTPSLCSNSHFNPATGKQSGFPMQSQMHGVANNGAEVLGNGNHGFNTGSYGSNNHFPAHDARTQMGNPQFGSQISGQISGKFPKTQGSSTITNPTGHSPVYTNGFNVGPDNIVRDNNGNIIPAGNHAGHNQGKILSGSHLGKPHNKNGHKSDFSKSEFDDSSHTHGAHSKRSHGHVYTDSHTESHSDKYSDSDYEHSGSDYDSRYEDDSEYSENSEYSDESDRYKHNRGKPHNKYGHKSDFSKSEFDDSRHTHGIHSRTSHGRVHTDSHTESHSDEYSDSDYEHSGSDYESSYEDDSENSEYSDVSDRYKHNKPVVHKSGIGARYKIPGTGALKSSHGMGSMITPLNLGSQTGYGIGPTAYGGFNKFPQSTLHMNGHLNVMPNGNHLPQFQTPFQPPYQTRRY